MANRISVKRAAELTGLSELTIREGIKQGKFEFGRAVEAKSGMRHNYHISPNKLNEYLGFHEMARQDLDPKSPIDAKIKLLEEEIKSLKSDVQELKIVINGLLDNQEYLIKKMNGGSLKSYSITFNSAISNFRKKDVAVFEEEKVTVKRAAELLGTSPLTVHAGLISGDYAFGTVTQKLLYDGKFKNVYNINAKKLADYLGLSVAQVKQ